MTIRKPVPSSRSSQSQPVSSIAIPLSSDITLPAIPTETGRSHLLQSPGREQTSSLQRDVWTKEPNYDGRVIHELHANTQSRSRQQSLGETRDKAPPGSSTTIEAMNTQTSRSDSQTSVNVPALATSPPSVERLVPEAEYNASPSNPFRQTKASQPLLPDQHTAEFSAAIHSDSDTEFIKNNVDATDSFQHLPVMRPLKTPSLTTSQPQPIPSDTCTGEAVGDFRSAATTPGYSNGLIELQKGLQNTDSHDLDAQATSKARAADSPGRITGHADPATSTEDRHALNVNEHVSMPQHSSLSDVPMYETQKTPAETDPTKTMSLVGTKPHTPTEERLAPVRAGETYQIRLVNWYDASSPTNPRRSPIMVQNSNGPCPLLALVNALVLSTPSNIKTALVETLRVREQVSLGLLLGAVIDELMSERRGDTAQVLPDVSELYAFLLTLHTGMNINPCFILSDSSEEKSTSLMDAPINEPSNSQDFRRPGSFEDTREMKLYSTFAVPLIHGWIPPRTHPAFASLKRAARTYEDAQNIMFREDELEAKLKNHGLNQEEEVMLEDIGIIKYFLSSTATQLTGYGLDTITETLAPGTIAILFRNDHFSTLYRHPKSGQLLTLVTDMGYAGHDEVVWESLVDVSGEGCEFFAGDFRPVGDAAGDTQQIQHDDAQDEEGWETVGKKSLRSSRSNQRVTRNALQSTSEVPALETLEIGGRQPAVSSNSEQEDHDLALAMQLQEEEEERERREAAARRREDELSQAYLNNADAQGRRTFPGFGRGAQGRPNVPPRGGSGTTTAHRSTPSARRRQGSSEDAPPPSYEQAAQGPAYHPPADHPAHPYAASPKPSGSLPRPSTGRVRQGSSAYSEHVSTYNTSPSVSAMPRRKQAKAKNSGAGMGQLEGAPGVVRRRSDMAAALAAEEDRKEKECVVM